MKNSKLGIFRNIFLGLLIILLIKNIFGLTFSLPTTFKDLIVEDIVENEQLVITSLDTERIANIKIATYTETGARIEVEIEDKDLIHTLLSNEVRLYRTSKFMSSENEYDLYIHFYGTTHRYFIGEDYIRGKRGDYKVLDDHNEVYESVMKLFKEGSK
ncbi:hypothetical protein [Ornithinibacillus halotolerans]|uniref:Uncharacterized protein n=1 Tax=Ornithinibacillus halotolerans TaxID=1274357 RepID=A0A916RKY1_9BACI|nr:hypothetical protein [Ornithinibacillus halotolerans]GGA60493.1 hypothetical protein GCM10008025_00650 [Ornithinibacillus halotolerans]